MCIKYISNIFLILQEENNNNVMSTGNKNHAAVALLQELQRTNAGKKFNITSANPLLAGTCIHARIQDCVICTLKLERVIFYK